MHAPCYLTPNMLSACMPHVIPAGCEDLQSIKTMMSNKRPKPVMYNIKIDRHGHGITSCATDHVAYYTQQK